MRVGTTGRRRCSGDVPLSGEGQVTDRYTKAIEQLGSKELDVRIGGIYALDRVARDSARDHPTVMEVLTAFIREHSPALEQPADPRSEVQERFTRPDVQAAVSVVGRRDVKRDIRPIHLDHADLSGADLTHARLNGAHLRFADLTAADLNGADLNGAPSTARTSAARNSTAQPSGGRATQWREALRCGPYCREPKRCEASPRETHRRETDRREIRPCGPRQRGPYGTDLTGANLRKSGLTDVIWPTNVPAPVGWKLDARSAW